MCECCGAALPIPNKYQKYIKCEYCDATYELDTPQEEPYSITTALKYVLIEPGHIKKYTTQVVIDEEKIKYYPPEMINKYVREQLANQLSEFLMNEIKIYENYDIMNFARIYRTVIRLDTRGY